MRNGEGDEDDSRGTFTEFSYRILDEGEPTAYYVKGHMHIRKLVSKYQSDYACEVYEGDPADADKSTAASAFECVMVPTEESPSDSHLTVDFTVKAH